MNRSISDKGQETNNKTIFLYVKGSDYAATDFINHYNPQEVYQEMLSEGVKEKIISNDEEYIEIEVKEFGYIDDQFLDFILREFCDEDNLASCNIFKVKS